MVLCVQGLKFFLLECFIHVSFSRILGSAMPCLYERRACFPTIVFTLSELVGFISFPTGSSDEEDCLTMRILFSPFKLQCRVSGTCHAYSAEACGTD